jgi:hypothetical protein
MKQKRMVINPRAVVELNRLSANNTLNWSAKIAYQIEEQLERQGINRE